MLKDATYKEKFAMLAKWMPAIMEAVKKDMRNEHLRKDVAFVRHYFQGKNPNKLTAEELAQAYSHHIANSDNTEELGEFICNRWLLKNSELYHHFEQALSKINPDFNEIDRIDAHTASAMMEEAVSLYGAPNTYLFCVVNSVVFPEEVYQKLSQRAEQEHHHAQTKVAAQKEQQSVEAMQRNYEQQIARLTDKYEKKLLGLQKKYTTDVETLKKQVANLQRKLG